MSAMHQPTHTACRTRSCLTTTLPLPHFTCTAVPTLHALGLQDKELPDYNPADISVALARMISYNIGQLAYLNAMRYNIKRIYFGELAGPQGRT